jgi:hypothetical protein
MTERRCRLSSRYVDLVDRAQIVRKKVPRKISCIGRKICSTFAGQKVSDHHQNFAFSPRAHSSGIRSSFLLTKALSSALILIEMISLLYCTKIQGHIFWESGESNSRARVMKARNDF